METVVGMVGVKDYSDVVYKKKDVSTLFVVGYSSKVQ